MPFTDISSYPVAGRELRGYWEQVNTFLSASGAPVLILPDNFSVDELTDALSAVETAIAAVDTQQTVVDTASNQIALLKGPVIERFKQLRRAFDAFLVGTKYANTLPLAPKTGTAGADWIKPINDAVALWDKVNGDASLTGVTRPITLSGGYALAQFQTDSSALTNAIQVREGIPTTLEPLINERNAKMEILRERCVQLRPAVQSQLASSNPLLLSLPVASPPRKVVVGAVKLSVATDPVSGARVLTWTAPDATAVRVTIRTSAGPKYKEADSRGAADLDPTVLSWTIDAALLPMGATVWFKAVSVSSSGNVASSNTVKGSL